MVLFDEIEKAHSEVFNVLLQLLDDGCLTDGQGRTVDFRNTIVIMTSNLGTELWSDTDRPAEWIQNQVRSMLTHYFRPEFINRIDEIVVFKRLTQEDLKQIVHIQLNRVADRLEEAGYQMEVSDEAEAYLAEVGYDPVYGARPLKRSIQRELQDPLSMRLLAGDFHAGETIRVTRSGDELDFVAVAVAEPADEVA